MIRLLILIMGTILLEQLMDMMKTYIGISVTHQIATANQILNGTLLQLREVYENVLFVNTTQIILLTVWEMKL